MNKKISGVVVIEIVSNRFNVADGRVSVENDYRNEVWRSRNETLQRNNITTVALPVTVPVIALGLNAAAIDSIPNFLHGSVSSISSIGFDEECSICLAMFEDGERVKVLPECLHAYHSDCVDKWLTNKSSCPLCRSSLDSTATEIAIA
ncbi:hypothetical protein AgCh_039109 [Apium graveolens]